MMQQPTAGSNRLLENNTMNTLDIQLDSDQVEAINRIATCKGVVTTAGCAGCGKSTMLAF